MNKINKIMYIIYLMIKYLLDIIEWKDVILLQNKIKRILIKKEKVISQLRKINLLSPNLIINNILIQNKINQKKLLQDYIKNIFKESNDFYKKVKKEELLFFRHVISLPLVRVFIQGHLNNQLNYLGSLNIIST